MNKDNLENKGLIRDYRPFTDIVYNLAKYHKAGESIRIVEIGVRRGVSTRAFLEGLNDRLPTKQPSEYIEMWGIDIENRDNSIRIPELRKLWNFIQHDSTTLDWDKPIDILHIDGNHWDPYPKLDYQKYEPFVKKGGYIIFHDSTHFRYDIGNFIKENVTYPHVHIRHNTEGLCIITKI